MKIFQRYLNPQNIPLSSFKRKELREYLLKGTLTSLWLLIGGFILILGALTLLRIPIKFKWNQAFFLFAVTSFNLIINRFSKTKLVSVIFIFSIIALGLWETYQNGILSIFVLYFAIATILTIILLNLRWPMLAIILAAPPIITLLQPNPNIEYIITYIAFMTAIITILSTFSHIKERLEDDNIRVIEKENISKAAYSINSSLDLAETIRSTLTSLENIIPYDSACILLKTNANTLEIVDGRGWEDPQSVIGLEFPIPGNNPNTEVMKTGKPLILNDAPVEYPDFNDGPHSHIRSWLGVPLQDDEKTIGMLVMDHTQPHFFNQDHIRNATIFADYVTIALQNAMLFNITQNDVQRRSVFYQTSQKILSATTDTEAIYKAIYYATSQLMPCNAFVLSLILNDMIEGVYIIDKDERVENIRAPIGTGLSGKVIAQKKPILIPDIDLEENFPGIKFWKEDRIRSLVAVPLRIGDEIIGSLAAQSYEPNMYEEADQEILDLLAAYAAIGIKNAQLLSEVEKLALSDGLTGVLNRRAFDEKIAYEIERAERYSQPTSMIIIDVDNFKQMNDQYGHNMGDKRLKKIAHIISDTSRSPDLVARIGGEEFALILPNTSLERAAILAERIRANIEQEFVPKDPTIPRQPASTVSIGVAEFPRHAKNSSQLYIASDKAMFQAKNEGKNAVRLAKH